MISVEAALSTIRANRFQPGHEIVPLASALGRVLDADLVSPIDFPQFDNSAMDGFAVGSPEGPWEILGEAAAGSSNKLTLAPCQAVRIFTGAPTPIRTYGVIPKEDASEERGLLVGEVRRGGHIRRQAEEASVGHLIARRGSSLTPPLLAAIAGCGLEAILVQRLPKIAVLSTGNEVVRPGQRLQFGQIFNSNATALSSVLALRGIDPEVRHAADCSAELRSHIDASIQSSDLLITTGGISVGSYDLVRAGMEDAGFQMKFKGVAVKPGKPIAFGTREDGKAWFGLPGNPLSTWVGFLVFVSAWLGSESPLKFSPVACCFSRNPGREEFFPATRLPSGEVVIKQIIGSHANFGLLECDGLVRVLPDVCSLSPGDLVGFLSFPWSRNP